MCPQYFLFSMFTLTYHSYKSLLVKIKYDYTGYVKCMWPNLRQKPIYINFFSSIFLRYTQQSLPPHEGRRI